MRPSRIPMSQVNRSDAVATKAFFIMNSRSKFCLRLGLTLAKAWIQLRNQAVVLGSPVIGEIKDIALVVEAGVQITFVHDHLVFQSAALRHDLTGRGHDQTLSDHVVTLLKAGLGDTDGPSGILIASGLEDQMIVKRL